mmetsp:Transcript_34882/g.59265  ORF Transcript_34882/g.59265 Transcript_34882/m.59265 type:complete len:118 (+) Transcript_34882:205-558(+)
MVISERTSGIVYCQMREGIDIPDVPKMIATNYYACDIGSSVDLMILAKAGVFVGKFTSHWGRLIRLLPLKMNDGSGMNGGDGVVNGETAEDMAKKPSVGTGNKDFAWRFQHPGPPGW